MSVYIHLCKCVFKYCKFLLEKTSKHGGILIDYVFLVHTIFINKIIFEINFIMNKMIFVNYSSKVFLVFLEHIFFEYFYSETSYLSNILKINVSWFPQKSAYTLSINNNKNHY